MLYPFRRSNNQKLVSVIAMIMGGLLMVTTPVIKLGTGIAISGFVVGVIIALVGFLYFLDIQ